MEACFKEAWVMEVNPFSLIWCQDEHPYVGNHVGQGVLSTKGSP